MMPERAARREDVDKLIDQLGWLLTLIAITFGVVIIACHIESGRKRWVATAWHYALIVPGSPATWGAVILVGGLLMAYGRAYSNIRAMYVGAWIAFGWFCVLTGTVGAAVSGDLFNGTRTANPVAAVTWFGFACLYRVWMRFDRTVIRS